MSAPAGRKADPSTPLRFAQDDKFGGARDDKFGYEIPMMKKLGISHVIVTVLFTGCAWLLINPASLAGQEQKPEIKKLKSGDFHWNPPQIDARIKPLLPDPPCVLPAALQKAAERADALFSGLKGFTAREDIQFQESRFRQTDQNFIAVKDFARSYNYTVFFRSTPTGFVPQDSRTARSGDQAEEAFAQDLGLPTLALIFLAGMQPDYDFKCEGTVEWNGKPAWVVRFKQRKDKPHRTTTFRGANRNYPASVRGRAWILTESGEVAHMETMLMEPVLEVGIENLYLSIDYAPVFFPAKNLRLLLPRTVDTYTEYPEWRTIAYHSFSEFKLFGADISIKPTAADQ
jgi:hypothetical protein